MLSANPEHVETSCLSAPCNNRTDGAVISGIGRSGRHCQAAMKGSMWTSLQSTAYAKHRVSTPTRFFIVLHFSHTSEGVGDLRGEVLLRALAASMPCSFLSVSLTPTRKE